MRDPGPGAIVGWIKAHGEGSQLAGAAFLVGPDVALTCAHVVRDHLGLDTTPAEAPGGRIMIRLEALGAEVPTYVAAAGWFPDFSLSTGYFPQGSESPRGLSDIAVLCLDRPVQAMPFPGLARRMPGPGADKRRALVYGAEAGYESIGQEVEARIAGSDNNKGWRQLDPVDSNRGFLVERGYSGAPALDDLGNLVWGMIVSVDAQKRGVAFVIPADALAHALMSAGLSAEFRRPAGKPRSAEPKVQPTTKSRARTTPARTSKPVVERAVLAEAGAPLPPRIDFSEEMGPVRDQGPEGSVVGFVIAAVMEHLILKKTARKIQLSARAIYNLAKKSPQDTGAMLADGVAVVQREGAVLEQVWPYKPGDFGKKPPAKFGKAERFKVAKAFQIEDQRKIREALCAYGPLAAGIVVHSSFWKTGKTGVVPKPAGGIIGGHAICLVGYDDKIARFKFRNSWARSWGDNGYGYLPYAYATTEILQDIWALQLA